MEATIVPLYSARIEDLGPGDLVKVECGACGHDMLIPAVGLLQGMRVPPSMRIVDLEPRLRCRECDTRGKAIIAIKWADSVNVTPKMERED